MGKNNITAITALIIQAIVQVVSITWLVEAYGFGWAIVITLLGNIAGVFIKPLIDRFFVKLPS
jgi:hypothetical protein